MHFALPMEPVMKSINPALSRATTMFTNGRKTVANRTQEAYHKAHEATIVKAQSSMWTMLSSVIPDDAYDWEGDMFENDFSPAELEGISGQLRSNNLGSGGE